MCFHSSKRTLKAEHRMDDMEEAADNHITVLEASCEELQVVSGLLRDTVKDLEWRSHRLNIRIGITLYII